MTQSNAKLVVRNPTPKDVPSLITLYGKVYGPEDAYSADQLLGQINRFGDDRRGSAAALPRP